jgi:hypothetical protein
VERRTTRTQLRARMHPLNTRTTGPGPCRPAGDTRRVQPNSPRSVAREATTAQRGASVACTTALDVQASASAAGPHAPAWDDTRASDTRTGLRLLTPGEAEAQSRRARDTCPSSRAGTCPSPSDMPAGRAMRESAVPEPRRL